MINLFRHTLEPGAVFLALREAAIVGVTLRPGFRPRVGHAEFLLLV
jgi:hypothetical protein